MAVHIEPQGIDSSLPWMDTVTPADCYGLVRPSYDTSNTVIPEWTSGIHPPPSRVDRGIEFAMRHDMNLLRRLAD